MNAIRRRLQLGLFAPLLLLVGQWLAVAHATQHELTAQSAQVACEICIVAHGAGALPVAVAAPLQFDVIAGPVLARLTDFIPPPFVERPRSRAPPFLI